MSSFAVVVVVVVAVVVVAAVGVGENVPSSVDEGTVVESEDERERGPCTMNVRVARWSSF